MTDEDLAGASKKARGAYFTPPEIAEYLSDWAVAGDPQTRVMDPTCGGGVFLIAAGRQLRSAGADSSRYREQVFGVDIHGGSIGEARDLLFADRLDATLIEADLFDIPTPSQLGSPLPFMDAIVGNPPFIRYQIHAGATRAKSARAAMREGVHLSGLASSWAATLVQAAAFLKSEGRLAMVLPAELLSVQYAEPIRRWLRDRFGVVSLVVFEQLQFEHTLEHVVLVLAEGRGSCDAFSLFRVANAEDLFRITPSDARTVDPGDTGKWTDMLLPLTTRGAFNEIAATSFVPLDVYGSPELGTVTGANAFFALSEDVRQRYELNESQVAPISPPGTRHLRGSAFSAVDWRTLRDAGAASWLLFPDLDDRSPGLARYLRHGKRLGVHLAYKCQTRDPWWRPPMVSPPDMFFTYMSHRFPRLIANSAGVSFVNSMHGVRLRPGERWVKRPLSLLSMNSVTMLGAEIGGRSYGGGILKMEPREAAALRVPHPEVLHRAWEDLRLHVSELERQLRGGEWTAVVDHIDEVLLLGALGLKRRDVARFRDGISLLRGRRLGRAAA